MNILRVLFLNLIFVSTTTMTNDKPAGVDDEKLKLYLEHQAAWKKMLKERFENELNSNPPEPPWVKFPDYSPNHIFWRMGKGEDYLVDYFGVYFKYATKTDLKAYKLKYPEHKDWTGTYESYEN